MDASVYQNYQMTFTNSATRTIRIVGDGNPIPYYLLIPPTNSLSPVVSKPQINAVVIGDSRTESPSPGANAVNGVGFDYVDQLGKYAPNLNVIGLGMGGTGYTNMNLGVGNDRLNFGQRFATDVQPYNPGVIIYKGGGNDSGMGSFLTSTNAVKTILDNTFYQCSTGCPNAKVFALIEATFSPVDSSTVLMGTMISNSIQKYYGPNAYIDTINSNAPWITGTNISGNGSGSGNAYAFEFTDGAHFNLAGIDYTARRLASELAVRGVSVNYPDTSLPAGVVTNGQAAVALTNGAFTGTHKGTNYFIWNPFAGYVPLATPSNLYNPGSGGALADAGGVYAPNGTAIMDNNGNYGAGNGVAISNVTASLAVAPMEFDINILDGCGGTIAAFNTEAETLNRDLRVVVGALDLSQSGGIYDSLDSLGLNGQIMSVSNSLPIWLDPTSLGGSANLTNVVPFFNVKTFGALGDGTSDDTTAIQAAVNAAQATNGIVWFDTGTYKITKEILATNPCAFHGSFAAPLFGKNSVYPNTSAVMVAQAPYLTGAVIVQTTAYSNILHLRPSSSAINVENLGLKFADTIKFTTTGHGILCDAPTNSGYGYDWGLQGASWQNVFVYGHDGNHYAFKLINYQLDSFINLQGYGGGGIESYCDSFFPSASQSAGNSAFYAPYFCTTIGGAAHGYYLHASAASGQGNYLITFVRPQSFFNMRGTNQPTTSQYQFYADDKTAILDCYGGDWESGPGNGGGGVHLPSNMLSGVTPSALGSTVDHTFFKSTWQSGGVTAVPSLVSVDIMSPTTASPTFTQTSGNVLSIYGGSGQYAFFNLGTTPGVNLMALGACNTSGQGFSTSSSGSAVITATVGDLLLGASPGYPNLIPEAIRVPNNTSNVIINGTLTLSKGVTGNGSGLTSLSPAGLSSYTATNTLVVTATGLTNATADTYLVSVTAGSSLAVKDGNGNQFLAPVLGMTFPLKPAWRFTGTAVTGIAVLQSK
jgi:hypothetical protein